MAYRQAAKAAGRWPADAATATLASPTATGPIRWAIATRARKRVSASSRIASSSARASSS